MIHPAGDHQVVAQPGLAAHAGPNYLPVQLVRTALGQADVEIAQHALDAVGHANAGPAGDDLITMVR